MARIGSYELEGELGRGGMGRVFRARHVLTGTVRALKLLEGVPDSDTTDRFRREGQALAQVGGTGVVAVHESGADTGRFYLVMDLMPGGSVRARLQTTGKCTWGETARLGASIARTLARCHGRGLVHRDVKPDNILYDEQGEPRLADFGCVRDLGASRLTQTGTVIGTITYMAPEILNGGKATTASDVYSLGVVLHELLSGAVPYAGSSFTILRDAVAEKRPPLLADVPEGFKALVARALSPDRGRRPGAAELALALEQLASGKTGERANRAWFTVLSLAVIAVAVAVALPRRTSPAVPHVEPPRPLEVKPAEKPIPESLASRRAARAARSLKALMDALGEEKPLEVGLPKRVCSDLTALADADPVTFAASVAPCASMVWREVAAEWLPPTYLGEEKRRVENCEALFTAFAETRKRVPLEIESGLDYLEAWRHGRERSVTTLRSRGLALVKEHPLWGATLLHAATEARFEAASHDAGGAIEGSLATVAEDLETALAAVKAPAEGGEPWAIFIAHAVYVKMCDVECYLSMTGNAREHLDKARVARERALALSLELLVDRIDPDVRELVALHLDIAREIRRTTRDRAEIESHAAAIWELPRERDPFDTEVTAAELARILGDPAGAVRRAANALDFKTTEDRGDFARIVIALARLENDRDPSEALRLLGEVAGRLDDSQARFGFVHTEIERCVKDARR